MVDFQPAPLSRESYWLLRDRRRAPLTVEPISYREWNTVYDTNSEIILVFEDDDNEEAKQNKKNKKKRASLTRTLRLAHECHLVKIMDGLYIALADTECTLRALRTFDNEAFTHIVRGIYKNTPRGRHRRSPQARWRRKEGPRYAAVQRLELICPAITRRMRTTDVALRADELIAARDFLTLALPHGKDQWFPHDLMPSDVEETKQGQQESRYPFYAHDGDDDDDDAGAQDVYLARDHPELDDLLDVQSSDFEVGPAEEGTVNVLIVAPHKRAIDVMLILLCYLSFLEDTTPDQLELDCSDPVWDDVMHHLRLAGRGARSAERSFGVISTTH